MNPEQLKNAKKWYLSISIISLLFLIFEVLKYVVPNLDSYLYLLQLIAIALVFICSIILLIKSKRLGLPRFIPTLSLLGAVFGLLSTFTFFASIIYILIVIFSNPNISLNETYEQSEQLIHVVNEQQIPIVNTVLTVGDVLSSTSSILLVLSTVLGFLFFSKLARQSKGAE